MKKPGKCGMRGLLVAKTAVALLIVCGSARAQEADARRRARTYEPYIAQAAARHGVDPRLLWTIAYLESRFRPGAVSYKDGKPCAYGLMQFIPETAQRYGLSNPHDPYASIDAAARYVRDLTARFGGRIDLVLAGYNSGEGTVEAYRDGRRLILPTGKVINPSGMKTGGVPPYSETRNYVSNGAYVFSSITSAGIYNAVQTARLRRPAVAPAATKTDGESEATIEQRAPQGSLYITAAAEVATASTDMASDKNINPTTEAPVEKSSSTLPAPKRARTRSIYFLDK